MKFVTFCCRGRTCPGVLTEDGAAVVALEALGYAQRTLEAFILAAEREDLDKIRRELPQAPSEPLERVRLLAPIPEPRQEVIIQENNFYMPGEDPEEYRRLIREEKVLPTYFYKRTAQATGDGSPIPAYGNRVKELDYQVEVCAVTWHPIFQVTETEAKKEIFGYTLMNNLIARDLVLRHRRPYIATSLDGFQPMGPWIVTADEFQEDPVFLLQSYVNGELRQCATTEQQKFSFPYCMADLAQSSVLQGASFISSGTPFGTARDLKKPYLKPGDRVRCCAQGLGSMENTVLK